ncbi:MAG: TIGR02450 family Trp-rich protein [Salinisphaera sp.]|jgi:tryptophan-rich hypothetical protein|nr:TIGR02450 family Trp-rich protein [Salinisphaera sp.]
MNQINPHKLQHSKWTAIKSEHKEKHFMVIDLWHDENDNVTEVVLEAVLTRRSRIMPWRQLKDASAWQAGWH